MKPDYHPTVRRAFVTIDVCIYILLLIIFARYFGYPMVRDYIHFSTVYTEKTMKYNDLPGISFVNLVAGQKALNHGWRLENLNYVDEKSILKNVCSEFYPNFSATYREYINCIDEQAFSADDLILSWNNGERFQLS